jgi:hypothetical protein
LLLVLLNSLNTLAAEATRDSVSDYASLKKTIDQLRAQRLAADHKAKKRLDALTREKEAAIAARDFARAEQLHTRQIQITIDDQRATNSVHKTVIDFSRVVLGITDSFGNRQVAD